MNDVGRIQFTRPPANKDELWWFVYALWNVRIPRVAVCPDHVSPFDAFSEAYFGNEFNWVLWYGSRGTGKSMMLAILALTKSAAQEINTTLLGGSMAQSNNVHEHVSNLLSAPNAPKWVVANQIQSELKFNSNNWVRPLPASQKTVRGPHPHLTLLDEIDEMDRDIYDAAMGQAMEKENARGIKVKEMVVASSTWQNPIGTFQSVRDEALANGLPIRTWCWREVVKSEANPDGWMDSDFIDRKRKSVPIEMFRVEYDLGEPAGDARAIDPGRLLACSKKIETIDEIHKGNDDIWVFSDWIPSASYACGADWAKERDKTVIVVCRTDIRPHQVVYLRRMNRKPWPEMIKAFNDAIRKYNAVSAHDATGIGNVVGDLIDDRTHKFVMVGRERTLLLTEYVTAVENGDYCIPSNTPLYSSHKAATVDDLYSTSLKTRNHVPDDFAAMALCHNAATRQPPPASGQGVPVSAFEPEMLKPLRPDRKDEYNQLRQGDVEIRESTSDIGVFYL